MVPTRPAELPRRRREARQRRGRPSVASGPRQDFWFATEARLSVRRRVAPGRVLSRPRRGSGEWTVGCVVKGPWSRGQLGPELLT